MCSVSVAQGPGVMKLGAGSAKLRMDNPWIVDMLRR